MFKWCIPKVHGRRGAGLANELNGWAKAYIASRVLDMRLLAPAWGLNPRGYRQYFGASRLDWIQQSAMRAAMPTFELTESHFDGAYTVAFRETVQRFAEQHDLLDRKAFVLSVGGMWGGKGILREAYPFIRYQLLRARGTVSNLGELEMSIPPDTLRIAVHVRRGDFMASRPEDAPAGPLWNTALPLDWYVAVCRSLSEQLSVPHRFLLFSDAPLSDLRPLLRAVDPVTTAHQSFNVCSDLMAMANADLLVTSCSSFSTWAAALSGNPYIWHADNLHQVDGAQRIWDHGEPLYGERASAPRGVAVDTSGAVGERLVADLEAAHARRGWGNDLIYYGEVGGDHFE